MLKWSYIKSIISLCVFVFILNLVLFSPLPSRAWKLLLILELATFLTFGICGYFHLRLVRSPEGNFYSKFVLPNIITMGRIFIIPQLGIGIFHLPQIPELRVGVILIFALAVLSDALDGVLGRFLNCRSEFGRVLDPLADILFYLTTTTCLINLGYIRVWFFLAVLFRFIPSLLGGIILFIRKGPLGIQATLLGKVSCDVIAGVSGCIILYHTFSFDWLGAIFIDIIQVIASLLALFAGVWAIFRGISMLRFS
jgi:cardiolipin synthase